MFLADKRETNPSMKRTQYPVNLTETERRKLETIASRGFHREQKITRARILLRVDAGETDSEIAEELDCSRITVWRTRKKFHERDRLEAVERKVHDREYGISLQGL